MVQRIWVFLGSISLELTKHISYTPENMDTQNDAIFEAGDTSIKPSFLVSMLDFGGGYRLESRWRATPISLRLSTRTFRHLLGVARRHLLSLRCVCLTRSILLEQQAYQPLLQR